ncbi:MAG: glycosyltransferase family 4 protein [Campylobacter sp.]
MNILHTETLYNWGGEQNKIINEMSALKDLGHESMLFCNPNSEISKRARNLNFKVFECEMSKKNYHKSVPALCKAIRENKINFVITNGSTDSWNGAIAKAFLTKYKVSFIRERHNEFPIKSHLSKLLHTTIFDKIISVSPNVTKNLQNIGVKSEKIFYIPTFVDFDKLNAVKTTFKDEFHIPNNSILVGMFSSLYRKKGVYEFANAIKNIMQEYDNIYGVFGGNIGENTKKEILEIFDKNMQSRLIFTGFRNDVANVIKSIDIYIFPSHSEGCPTALLEAMALSRPIVAFDIEPMNKILENKGICVEFLNTQKLTDAIRKYLTNDALANSNGRNASDFIKKQYDIKNLKTYMKNLLESL